jgi:hypothetical protein
MALFANEFRLVFWLAAIPGLIAVSILILCVEEPQRVQMTEVRTPIRRIEIRGLGPRYWSVVFIATVLTLARFSEAFLILRAQNAGLQLALIPLVFVTLNVVYALSAYPMGAISDRLNRRLMLAIGFGVLIFCRHRACISFERLGCDVRRRALGSAFGADPGTASRSDCGHNPIAGTGHGVRPFSFWERHCASSGKSDCRTPLGTDWAIGDISMERWVHRYGPHSSNVSYSNTSTG